MSVRQEANKKKILERLTKTPIIEVACKQSGISRATFYRWVKQDSSFAEACDEAIEISASRINDLAESQLIAAIKEKNMTAIMYWLKHRHPVYETRIQVDANVRHDRQELTFEQIEIVEQALRNAGLLIEGAKNGR